MPFFVYIIKFVSRINTDKQVSTSYGKKIQINEMLNTTLHFIHKQNNHHLQISPLMWSYYSADDVNK